MGGEPSEVVEEGGVPSEGSEERTDLHDSRGTFIILLAYLVVIVGLWGSIYFTLLARG
jgi:hypothetical protein